MAEVVRERETGNHGHLPSQEREMGIAATGAEPIVDPIVASLR